MKAPENKKVPEVAVLPAELKTKLIDFVNLYYNKYCVTRGGEEVFERAMIGLECKELIKELQNEAGKTGC